MPTLQCYNKRRDLFTTNISDLENIGNKKLTYPVGLITSDEVIFAGGFGGAGNSTYYLYTNKDYWTMSPYYHNSNDAALFAVNSGSTLNCHGVRNITGLRPIINLRADTIFTGEGFETNPFVVSN